MKTRPLYRITIFLLPALMLVNLLLYAWFARKAWETSADEVVQKAYIVSRLLSELSASALDRGELAGLRRNIEEAFKDRHIVAVAVLDVRGKVIVQSTVPRNYHRLSTFETPVKVGEKSVATLVTSFSLDESDGIIQARLRRTAWLQFGLFAIIAALLAWFCRREQLALGAGGGRGYESPSVTTVVAAVMPVTTQVASVFPESAVELCSASSSLQKAAKLLSGEADRQLHAVTRARDCIAHMDSWRQQALHAGDNAASLIASGREIIAMVQGGTTVPCLSGTGQESAGVQGTEASGGLDEIIAAVDCLAGEMQDRTSAPLLSHDESLLAAAELTGEGVATMRERVFPAFATAAGAGENAAARIAPLLEKVAECGDRTAELSRCSAELFDLADGLRLLRRGVAPVGADGGEERLNSLAERMESLATRLKRESQDLLGVANEATAAGRSILTTMESFRATLLAAGATLEDSAASSMMGCDHLRGVIRRAGVEPCGDKPIKRRAPLVLLRELRPRLIALRGSLSGHAVPQPRQAEEHAQSLALASENLLLASRFLGEIATGAADLATAGLADLHETVRPSDTVVVGQLIAAANTSLGQVHLPVSAEGDEPGGGE